MYKNITIKVITNNKAITFVLSIVIGITTKDTVIMPNIICTNTSGILTSFSSDGDLRKSLKIANYGTGSGVVYHQQIQLSGQA
jgi:hypothetical protein